MNIKEKHTDKEVSAYPLFKGTDGTTMAIRILKDALLKEHITKTKALLICVSGHALFENEQGVRRDLKKGDTILIEPMIKHWVKGIETADLLLLK